MKIENSIQTTNFAVPIIGTYVICMAMKKYLLAVMNKYIMKIFITFSLVCIFTNAFSQSQPKKIYFLADTTDINSLNRVIDIGVETNIYKMFTIYCPCLNDKNQFAEFISVTKKGEIKPKRQLEKPDLSYIPFKDLVTRIAKYGERFDNFYTLHIVERLSDNKYVTWKVEIIPDRKATY